MNSIERLNALGQSLWYDNIERRLLENGELAAMIQRGEIGGVTSNPSIFHHAISKTRDYDSALVPMAWAGWEAEKIFWQLAVEDIQRTCDLFRPLFDKTQGADGYVSLEVHPALAHDGEATFAQAKDLWERVDRPNLMIKIPATKAGLPAIRAGIASGININVTLIFSIERYREVMDAYLDGLEEFRRQALVDGMSSAPASVASFFVSRMDTKVDLLLPKDSPLRGKAAVANAKLAYAAFQETFSGERWQKLLDAGGRIQRPLWASTSTKNRAYPDTLYVDELIGSDTVNTVPPQTLEAFKDHGRAETTLTEGVEDARKVFSALEEAGISVRRVTRELEDEGVRAFLEAFSAMLKAIEERRVSALESLGGLTGGVQRRIASLEAGNMAARLWDGDAALWTYDPKGQVEIRRRLGWLNLPETSRPRVKSIQAAADEIHQVGIRRVLLLGMGGSSLAPEVMSLVFPDNGERDGENKISFAILDSTDPAQVAKAVKEFPPSESLYIVSSKSGGTVEVNAMLEYFWQLSGMNGSRFVAITDPGTRLDALANERGFRHTLLTDPAVGGRFSVLADYGLLPMALMGYDIGKVLDFAARMMRECSPEVSTARNPGIGLGASLGESAITGRDKLTLIADADVAPFGSWLEQLIAESSGKNGTGIVVVDREPLCEACVYGEDRLFVYLKTTGEKAPVVEDIRSAGHPVLEFTVPHALALAGEFYRWEVATAVACHILGVNAFDQPDVQDNKDRTLAKMGEYGKTKRLEEPSPIWEEDGFRAFSNQTLSKKNLSSLLKGFLSLAKPGDYVAVNAYLPRSPQMTALLTDLRLKILRTTGCATTLGFGPRFLHSTGQLHKGGPASGLFLQITADPIEDIEIPTNAGESNGATSFGVLERAQALGDYEALEVRQRRILRLHLPAFTEAGRLMEALDGTFG